MARAKKKSTTLPPPPPNRLASVFDDPPRKNALLLSCMDQRLLDETVQFMNELNLHNRYDQVTWQAERWVSIVCRKIHQTHLALGGSCLPLTCRRPSTNYIVRSRMFSCSTSWTAALTRSCTSSINSGRSIPRPAWNGCENCMRMNWLHWLAGCMSSVKPSIARPKTRLGNIFGYHVSSWTCAET